MLDESGLSHLSVSDLARVIDAPVSTVKTSHRRLTNDGVLARTQVFGIACSTSIIIPTAAPPRTAATPDDVCFREISASPPTIQSTAPLADVIPRAQTRDDNHPALQAPAPASDQGTTARKPIPAELSYLMKTLCPGKETGDTQEEPATPPPGTDVQATLPPDPKQAAHERDKHTPAVLCADPPLASTKLTPKQVGPDMPPPGTDIQATLPTNPKQAASVRNKHAPTALCAEPTRDSSRFFPKIERAVADAVMGADRTDTYPDTGNLAAEVAWTLYNGVYRNRPREEGLRICLSTIRRGTWLRPKAFSPTEASALRYK
ncbi:MAG: hypothetical protein EOM91_20865 [Sphingobacteriia bacterium]|nr:hypothetical protein [Sphingobacteriia bacterium]